MSDSSKVKRQRFKWTTERWQIKRLTPWDDNPRLISRHDSIELGASLERFGLVDPLVANPDGSLIGGHQRLSQMLKDGASLEDYVDVRVPDRPLNDKERAELGVRLNRNRGEWDWDKLANFFDVGDLMEWGFNPEEFDPAIPDSESNLPRLQMGKKKGEVTCPQCGSCFDPKG